MLLFLYSYFMLNGTRHLSYFSVNIHSIAWLTRLPRGLRLSCFPRFVWKMDQKSESGWIIHRFLDPIWKVVSIDIWMSLWKTNHLQKFHIIQLDRRYKNKPVSMVEIRRTCQLSPIELRNKPEIIILKGVFKTLFTQDIGQYLMQLIQSFMVYSSGSQSGWQRAPVGIYECDEGAR